MPTYLFVQSVPRINCSFPWSQIYKYLLKVAPFEHFLWSVFVHVFVVLLTCVVFSSIGDSYKYLKALNMYVLFSKLFTECIILYYCYFVSFCDGLGEKNGNCIAIL